MTFESSLHTSCFIPWENPMPTPSSDSGTINDANPIEFRRLQIFVQSARSLSFAKSAKQLNLTPSAVSHAIRSLEEELSCVLFERHGPKIILTHVGSRVLPIAEDLLSRTEGLRREVSLFETESNQLRIRLPEILAANLLPKILPDFFECFPSFHVETQIIDHSPVSAEDTQETSPSLRLDLGLSPEEYTEHRNLFDLRFEFYVAPFHRLASSTLREPPELQGARFLVPHHSLIERLKKLRLNEEPTKQHCNWLLPSLASVQNLAAAGVGVALLTRNEASAMVEAGTLVTLPVSTPPIEVTCAAYWHSSNPPTWATEVLLNFAADLDEI